MNSMRPDKKTNKYGGNKPANWRMIIEKTIHQYIKFEQQGVKLSEVVHYVVRNLAKYKKPKHTCKEINENAPLWYLSLNAIRKALFRASINSTKLLLLQQLMLESLKELKVPGH